MLISNIIEKQKDNLKFLGKTDKNLDFITAVFKLRLLKILGLKIYILIIQS